MNSNCYQDEIILGDIMLRNEKLKIFLKSFIFPMLTSINKFVPKDDNLVLLYSPNRGIEHNLRPLRDYMLKHHYNKRYHIVCCVSSSIYFEDDGLEYVTQGKGIWYFFKTKHVFYTTGQIPIKPSRNQIVIHMDHGTTAIKTEGFLKKRYSGDINYFSLYCAPSKIYVDVIKKEFHCNDENIVINSEPVTDVLLDEIEKYDFGNYKKLGLWAPTFRKSDYLGYDDSNEEDLLPTLKSEDYSELNALLKHCNIKLIVKLHDMQELSKYTNIDFSNLIILSGKDFDDRGYKLYEILKQTDFLIGDYSSVFLQYLLLNKPIGFAIPDIDDYREKRGFIFEPIEDYMPGCKIKTKEELFQFIRDMADGFDNYKSERIHVNHLVNHFQDGKSCERLMQYSKMD